MQLTVISFYTNTWEYPQHAQRLAKECEALGLSHYIRELPTTGSWISNTRLKASFVHKTLELLQTPVLWIDVDGSILAKPTEIDLDMDFMARLQPTQVGRTFHVGTMFFNYTDEGRKLAKEWCDMKDMVGSDESAFDFMWKQKDQNVKWKNLPETYFRMFEGKPLPDDTVIFHRKSKDESKLRYYKRVK